MKATGIVRKVDELGRIVLPKELRDTKGIPVGTPLEIFMEGEYIVIGKYNPGCLICGSCNNVQYHGENKDKPICDDCAQGIAQDVNNEKKDQRATA